MNETQEPAIQHSKEHSDQRSVDWKKLKELTAKFIERTTITVATFLTLITLISPQLIANAQEFDDTLCSVLSVISGNAQKTSISCINAAGEETKFTLEFIIRKYNEREYGEAQIRNPPFFTSEYASNIFDPNFNCHSQTLQHIQEASGVDFGASRDRWLEKGLDTFLQEFGTEITRLDTIPDEMTEDVIDISNVQPGDVVLFFDGEGKLFHSATATKFVTNEDGVSFLQIINKLGQEGELYSSIDDMVMNYELDGEFDEELKIGGGSIRVYRPNLDLIQSAFGETSLQTNKKPDTKK